MLPDTVVQALVCTILHMQQLYGPTLCYCLLEVRVKWNIHVLQHISCSPTAVATSSRSVPGGLDMYLTR